MMRKLYLGLGSLGLMFYATSEWLGWDFEPPTVAVRPEPSLRGSGGGTGSSSSSSGWWGGSGGGGFGGGK